MMIRDAILIISAAALFCIAGVIASRTPPDAIKFVHTQANEVGLYCVNGTDPVVVGMEEKYLIIRCEAKR